MTLAQFCEYLSDPKGECVGDGLIPYLNGIYCSPLPVWLIIIFYILWLVVLFYLLGAAADDYLCPSLSHISETLRVPPDIAGLTFMALGNGAPDVFGTFVAVTGYKYGISIGELLGAGFFVTSVVVGVVALTSVAKLSRFSFLRDVSCYLIGVIMFIGFLSDGAVHLVEAVLMLVYYVSYVLFASIIALWLRRRDRRAATLQQQEASGLLSDSDEDDFAAPKSGVSVRMTLQSEDSDEQVDALLLNLSAADSDEEEEEASALQQLKQEFLKRSIPRRVLWVISNILLIPLKLTCPNVEDGEWNRYLTAFTVLVSPSFAVFAFKLSDDTVGGGFPVAVIPAIIGVVLAVLLLVFTRNDDFPRWKLAISGWTFIVSIVWIYLLANELVDMLNAFGLVLNISEVILGATVLAWGSSVGDLVANVIMARQGFPEMAIAAAFGGPLFNMFFGSSISLIYMTAKTFPFPYPTQITLDSIASSAFLVVSLLTSLIVVHFADYTVPRNYAKFFLIPIYVAYFVVLVLIGSDIIPNVPVT